MDADLHTAVHGEAYRRGDSVSLSQRRKQTERFRPAGADSEFVACSARDVEQVLPLGCAERFSRHLRTAAESFDANLSTEFVGLSPGAHRAGAVGFRYLSKHSAACASGK